MRILVLNCGSSSVKFAVYALQDGQLPQQSAGKTQSPQAMLAEAPLALGLVENIGGSARLKGKGPKGAFDSQVEGQNHTEALAAVMTLLETQGAKQGLGAVSHRVVHGGEKFSGSVLITPQVLSAVRDCNRLAPLHNPANLLGIEISMELFPGLPQVAVFDTAFHQTIPAHAYHYALPNELYTQHGVRRYGFHGTSHRFVSEKATRFLQQEGIAEPGIITAHLGNGCSATAVQNGRSLDTSMGMTPLEGLVMGTRSGTIDPGILGYLHEVLGYDTPALMRMLNKESGLLGLSGLSHDMRTLAQAMEQGHAGARLAIEVFCYRLAREIAALVVALPRLHALVFTGGIGENSTLVRQMTLAHLGVLGFAIDAARNSQHGRASKGIITVEDVESKGSANSTITPLAMVIATDEEWLIASDALHLIKT